MVDIGTVTIYQNLENRNNHHCEKAWFCFQLFVHFAKSFLIGITQLLWGNQAYVEPPYTYVLVPNALLNTYTKSIYQSN